MEAIKESKVLVKQYQENERKIKQLKLSQTKIEEKRTKKIYNLEYEIYRDKMKALEEERDEKITQLKKEGDEIYNKYETKKEELYKIIRKVDKIIKYLKVEKKDFEIKDTDIKHYERDKDRYFKWFDYFYNDNFLKIRLLVAENDKPKNKYSLTAYGKCLFGEEIIKLPYSYSMCLNDSFCGFNLKLTIRDFDSLENLNIWFEKNKNKILKETFEEYQKVKTEYLETIKNYKLKDFDIMTKKFKD